MYDLQHQFQIDGDGQLWVSSSYGDGRFIRASRNEEDAYQCGPRCAALGGGAVTHYCLPIPAPFDAPLERRRRRARRLDRACVAGRRQSWWEWTQPDPNGSALDNIAELLGCA